MAERWRIQLDRYDQALRREERNNIRKRARPEEEVFAEIDAKMRQAALDNGFDSVDEYRHFLDLQMHPELNESEESSQVSGAESSTGVLNPKNRTQKKSKRTGIIFDTTNWDAKFKLYGIMKEDDEV